MSVLCFESAKRVVPSAPERADIALFVGFCQRRSLSGKVVPVPAAVARFLVEQGFSGRFDEKDPYDPLKDVPVLIERWEVFDRLFAWEEGKAGQKAPGMYLGASVRSFFAQGGRKCYVVRLDDSYDLASSAEERRALVDSLLPGRGALYDASAADPSTFHGAGHVLGLPDVAFLCVPDLAALCGGDPAQKAPEMPKPFSQEVFVPCSEVVEMEDLLQSEFQAPRCDGDGYEIWAQWLSRVQALVSRLAREVQVIAGIPLPMRDVRADTGAKAASAEHDVYAYLTLSGVLERFESRFIQLAYPWVKTTVSRRMPEGLESPEGVLAGVLARNALSRGTVRNGLGLPLSDVMDVFPVVSVREQESRVFSTDPETKCLLRRVSLMGPTPSGLRLLSDVSTSSDERFRQAHVGRLFSSLSRALKTVGADTVFEPSGERTWGLLVRKVEGVLERMWRAGGLNAETPQKAYSVRCDRTTMTQSDMDAGRLVADVQIVPAAAIEKIYVTISLSAGGGLVVEEKGVS